MTTEIQNKIKTIRDKKQTCRFYISVDKVEKYVDGFVVDTSKQFVLVREFVDFDAKGFVIIPINKIIKLRQARAEKSFTRILKLEKLVEKALIFEKMPLENYVEIFKSIKKRYKYAIVENAFEGVNDFCIGEIARINKESISILYFDITGKVDKTTTKIPFKHITNIDFETNYINTFIRHLK